MRDIPPAFYQYRAVLRARNSERDRVTDLLEQAIYEADDEATVTALVKLTGKVLLP